MGLWNLFNDDPGPPVSADAFFVIDQYDHWAIDKEYAEKGESEGWLIHVNTFIGMTGEITYYFREV